MNELKDGGPAFPSLNPNQAAELLMGGMSGDGMTLRDYFAAKAIPKCFDFRPVRLTQRLKALFGIDYCTPTNVPTRVAEEAYKIADAMLAERRK